MEHWRLNWLVDGYRSGTPARQWNAFEQEMQNRRIPSHRTSAARQNGHRCDSLASGSD
jgi:hypothetical protein